METKEDNIPIKDGLELRGPEQPRGQQSPSPGRKHRDGKLGRNGASVQDMLHFGCPGTGRDVRDP